MKTSKLILALLVAVTISLSASAQKKSASTETVTFLTSIECQNCVNKLEKNIPFEKGVKDMKANFTTTEVTIVYDAKKTDKEKLKKAIEKLGYTAEEAVKEEEAKK